MATIYISADIGNDSTGNGSIGNPYLTISKAHTEATSGDTVICLDSTNTFAWGNFTFTKELTIRGQQDDASGAVFDAGTSDILWTHSANVSVERLTFQNALSTTAWTARRFVLNTDSLSYIFKNCKYRNIIVGGRSGFQGHGMFTIPANRTGIYFEIENCLFEDSISSTNASLGKGGTFFNFRAMTDSDIVITNNTFHVGNFSGETRMDELIHVVNSTGSDLALRNNIYYTESTQDTSIITGNSSLTTIVYTNNDIYRPSGTVSNNPTGSNNLNADPLFVDKDNQNYNLQPSSPCIDTGVTL
jgi:hypothetical protein